MKNVKFTITDKIFREIVRSRFRIRYFVEIDFT